MLKECQQVSSRRKLSLHGLPCILLCGCDTMALVESQFNTLPAHERLAVRFAWRGWQSGHKALADIWGELSEAESDDPPDGIEPLDWWRLCRAADASKEQRCRWAWHNATSELMSMMPEGAQHERASTLACDALNMTTDAHAVLACSMACRTVIAGIGKPAARVACRMIYEETRPSAALMWDTVGEVGAFEYGGRVYVL